MTKNIVLAAAILGSAAFIGSLQAAPYKHDNAMVRGSHSLRVPAAEKREVEGTKADVKEDKAEAKAMMHHRITHHRHHKAAVHKM